ncbi:hypothetical protein ACFVVX_02885 [Kitasatospora sp. NPDC058170]
MALGKTKQTTKPKVDKKATEHTGKEAREKRELLERFKDKTEKKKD